MSLPERRAIRVSREWLGLLDELRRSPCRVMVVGPIDSGKSTLAAWLTERLSESLPVASIDTDVGQSRIGPPATVGLVRSDGDEHHYFVGDVTPADRAAAMLSGLLRAVDDAERDADSAVIIDTTGYVDGDAALAMKVAKVEMLLPLCVVAIGDSRPVRRIAAAVGDLAGVSLMRVPTADSIAPKSSALRRQYRADRFAEALAGSNLRWIDLHGRAIQGTADGPDGERSGLLTGFQDRHHHLVCLGLLKSVDRRGGRILAQASASAEQASGVVFGHICLGSDGRRLDEKHGADTQ